MLKAIDTHYNGYKFRSRLEARWAVFFDTLGIKYEYEKEGYNLAGIYYLPDFWLPKQKCWVEVKGQPLNEKEIIKCTKLAEACKCDVYIHGAVPHIEVGGGFTFENEFRAFKWSETSGVWDDEADHIWSGCINDATYEITFSGKRHCDCRDHNGMCGFDEPSVCLAYRKARTARFEHGENGI